MSRLLTYIAAFLLLGHGLIHLMGFVAYWPIGQLEELPYKTTVLNGRFDLGINGTRLYSLVWLAVGAALVGGTLGLWLGQSWWLPTLLLALLVSLLLCLLDWETAYLGAVASGVALIPLLFASGLRVEPQPFDAFPQLTEVSTLTALPAELPPPVPRFYRAIAGETLPVMETAVITARGTVRFQGLTFPARLRFTHQAGQGYRHYIETTFYGLPLMRVNEWFLDGNARLELPGGIIEDEPKVDMAANLGLWGESIWLPTIFITDARVRWEPIDQFSARLIVPFDEREDSFVVTFDPQTGLLKQMEAMRYREVDAEKILWRLDVLAWDKYDGVLIPSHSTATWADEGTPWLVVEIDDVVYNADVNEYIQAKGP